jgi:putative transposase
MDVRPKQVGINRLRCRRPAAIEITPLELSFADIACSGNNCLRVQSSFGRLFQPVLRPSKVTGFIVPPKRWIVERTFGWLGRYRRHSKDYERNTPSSEATIYISMIHVIVRRLERAKS